MEFLQTWQQKQWGDSVQHEKISAKDLDVIGELSQICPSILISLINVKSRLPILKNSTLHVY